MPNPPSNTIVVDLCIQTPWALRRQRNYYVPDTPPPGITELEAIGNAIKAHFAPSWVGVMTTQCSLLRAECRYYGSGQSLFEGNSTSAASAGTVPAATAEGSTETSSVVDTLPDEVNLIFQIRTGNVGRKMQGRRFLCGLSEVVQNAGKVDPDWKTYVKNMADKFPQDINVVGTYATVLHARHYNRKDNSLHPITKAYALGVMGTRKDRRNPLRLERL